MEYSEAIAVLRRLIETRRLSGEEKEALETAIGLLSIGALTMSKVKEKKARRDKSLEW